MDSTILGLGLLVVVAVTAQWFYGGGRQAYRHWRRQRRIKRALGYVDPVVHPRPSSRLRIVHSAPRVTGDPRSVAHVHAVQRLRARVRGLDRREGA